MPSKTAQQTMFFNLDSQLNQNLPLYLLANKIDWNLFEDNFKKIQTCAPCTPTELIEFRMRIGESGMVLILKVSIRVNVDHDDFDNSFIDSTVQEKNITFSTDAKLTKKIIGRCL